MPTGIVPGLQMLLVRQESINELWPWYWRKPDAQKYKESEIAYSNPVSS